MKKLIFKTAIFLAIVLNFTGCIQYVDGVVQIPDNSTIEKNKSTKLYYEDTNKIAIREDLSNLTSFLNSNQIKPSKLVLSENTTEVKKSDDLKVKFVDNSNQIINTKFELETNSNYIVSSKKYTSRNEAYLDFFNVWQFISEKTKNNTALKDKFGTSANILISYNTFYNEVFYIDELALNNGVLRFTTKRELSRDRLQERTELAFKKSGYTFVNNPSEADKIIYFQLTRDYQESEIKQLQKEGKNLDLGVINAGVASQTNKMESGMRLASSSNSSGTSVGAGLGIGLVFAILDAGSDHNIVLPTFKITDVKEGKSYLYIPKSFAHLYVDTTSTSKYKEYFNGDTENYYYAMLRIMNEDGSNYKKNPIK